ncbi:MAG: SRPBCC family protein [Rhizobacter sp.]
MASIVREFSVRADADGVWQKVRDFGAVHRVLAPGFVTDLRMEDGARVVTFRNGLVTRELLVDLDDAQRRLVYSARSERLVHHNAAVQVHARAEGGSRLVWTVDVLPDGMAPGIAAMMDEAVGVMKATLERG